MTKFRNPISHTEHHNFNDNSKLNWLRAAVLGANDGVVSVASIVLGVAGATSQTSVILTSGIAGLVAGALSMAVGEYVSVSTQRDTEKAFIEKEKWELLHEPEHELEELTKIYETKGLTRKTAEVVAKELTEKDALKVHLRDELNIDAEDLKKSNYTRFINHSKKPNCKFVVSTRYKTARVEALRNIKIGEELYLDYGPEFFINDEKDNSK
jgi:VIT1/CCC1 family predicted Fe2+/Mn2+ transporter